MGVDKMTERKFYQKKRILIPVIIGVALVFLGIFGAVLSSFYLITSNAFVEDFQIPVISKIEGRILSINVENNSNVKKGEIIFQLDSKIKADDIQKYENELLIAQNALKKFDVEINNINLRTKQTKRNIEDAKINLENANADYIRYKNEYKDGTVTKNDLLKAESNLETAQNQYEQAQNQIKQNNELSDKILAQKDEHLIKLKNAFEKLQEAKLMLSFATLSAPKSGQIKNIVLKEGDTVKKDEILAQIIPDECYIIAYFRPNHKDKLKLAKNALIKFYALDFKLYKGEIVEILPQKANLIPVKIKITNDIKKCKIKTNLKAYVKIKI